MLICFLDVFLRWIITVLGMYKKIKELIQGRGGKEKIWRDLPQHS